LTVGIIHCFQQSLVMWQYESILFWQNCILTAMIVIRKINLQDQLGIFYLLDSIFEKTRSPQLS